MLRQDENLIKEMARDSGYRKAAQFLIILGKQDAARVMKHLNTEEIEGLVREIARIRAVDPREARKLLEEFGYLVKSKDLVAQGGLEKAREMLIAAFGTEKGEAAFEKLRCKPRFRPFSFLEDMDFEQVFLLLKDESVPVISAIISCVDPALAARIVVKLPAEAQNAIAQRIGRMVQITPDVLRQAEDSLKEKIRTQGTLITQEIDGQAVLADILRYLDSATENTLLEELADRDPELAASLKNKLFTIDVIFRIPSQDLEAVLRDFSDGEIAVILKGKEEPVKERILYNVSSRRRDLIALEYEDSGKMLRTDVDRATADFLSYIKKRAVEGDLAILERDDEFV